MKSRADANQLTPERRQAGLLVHDHRDLGDQKLAAGKREDHKPAAPASLRHLRVGSESLGPERCHRAGVDAPEMSEGVGDAGTVQMMSVARDHAAAGGDDVIAPGAVTRLMAMTELDRVDPGAVRDSFPANRPIRVQVVA